MFFKKQNAKRQHANEERCKDKINSQKQTNFLSKPNFRLLDIDDPKALSILIIHHL